MTRSRQVTPTLRCLCAAAALLCAVVAQDRTPTSIVGRPAPAWTVDRWFQLPDGKDALSPADFRGKVVYLFGFQSWCPACHSRGFPTLRELCERYRGRDDVAFVAVQTVFEGFDTNTPERARATVAKYGLSIPFGHDAGPDRRGSRLMRAYHTRGTPWTIVIDKDGIVRYSDFHLEVAEAQALIDRLAAAPPAQNPLIGRAFGALDGLRWPDGDPGHAAADTPPERRLTLYRWWTDGCPFCRASLPDLWRVGEQYRERGLRVVAIYHQKRPTPPSDDELRAYLKDLGYRGELAVDPGWGELRVLLKRAELTSATSVSFLVDGDGTVRWVHEGPRIHRSDEARYARADADMRELEALLAELLAEPMREKRDRERDR